MNPGGCVAFNQNGKNTAGIEPCGPRREKTCLRIRAD